MRFAETLAFVMTGVLSANAHKADQEVVSELSEYSVIRFDQATKEFLYDQLVHDVIIDGHVSEILPVCTNFEMRFRRSDGKIVVRRVGRCD